MSSNAPAGEETKNQERGRASSSQRSPLTPEDQLQVRNLLSAVNQLRDEKVKRLTREMADQTSKRLEQCSHVLALLPVGGPVATVLLSSVVAACKEKKQITKDTVAALRLLSLTLWFILECKTQG